MTSNFSEAQRIIGKAMAEYRDDEIVYGLDDRCLKWHRRKMLKELEGIIPWPRSRKKVIERLKNED